MTRDVSDCSTCALNQVCDTTNLCLLPTYTVGGEVSGLTGNGLVLSLSGTEALPRSSNGSYTFAKALDNGSSYTVAVQGQPTNPWQTCTTTHAHGTIHLANVTNANVACVINTTLGETSRDCSDLASYCRTTRATTSPRQRTGPSSFQRRLPVAC